MNWRRESWGIGENPRSRGSKERSIPGERERETTTAAEKREICLGGR